MKIITGLIALACALGAASPAHAEGFISPLVGFDFGGDASCPAINSCQDKRLNYGISLGAVGNVFGFEEEFSYAPDFFGTAPNLKSSVVMAMSNVMLAPKVGPIRPYLLAGVGLIKTHVDFTTTSLLTTDNSHFGWDIGGGLMVTVAPHFGVRGDLCYFHSFQELSVLGFSVNNSALNFGRAAGAVFFMF